MDNGSTVASVVDTVSVVWQASDVVTRLGSAAARPGAVAELLFQSDPTPWYKILEITVATSMSVVSPFPVRMKGTQGKKRAEFMFGDGKGLHRSWSY